MQKMCYFDNAATTLISKAALDEYNNTALSFMGNPSATHRLGRTAHARLEECRSLIADVLGIKAEQLFFTSGATESISIVLSSLLWAKQPGEVILSAIEHEAVLSWASILQEKGWTVKTIRAKGGFVSPEELEGMISEKTKLVAVQMVNNATGAIEDIDALVKTVRRKESEYRKKIFFFSDAVQALGKVPFSLTALDVDGASFSAHKISGPRGVGALYLKKGSIQSLSKGGGQEKGVRGGTENLPAIAGFAEAVKEIHSSDGNVEEINAKMRELFQNAGIKLLSPEESYSPYILSITTPIPSEVMTRMLADRGFCVSSGSACSNNARGKAENVILSMGFSSKDAGGVVRISFAHTSSIIEAEALAEEIIKIVKEFR